MAVGMSCSLWAPAVLQLYYCDLLSACACVCACVCFCVCVCVVCVCVCVCHACTVGRNCSAGASTAVLRAASGGRRSVWAAGEALDTRPVRGSPDTGMRSEHLGTRRSRCYEGPAAAVALTVHTMVLGLPGQGCVVCGGQLQGLHSHLHPPACCAAALPGPGEEDGGEEPRSRVPL